MYIGVLIIICLLIILYYDYFCNAFFQNFYALEIHKLFQLFYVLHSLTIDCNKSEISYIQLSNKYKCVHVYTNV